MTQTDFTLSFCGTDLLKECFTTSRKHSVFLLKKSVTFRKAISVNSENQKKSRIICGFYLGGTLFEFRREYRLDWMRVCGWLFDRLFNDAVSNKAI
jgi:hypothetical protein